MPDKLIEILININIGQLIAIGLIAWFFYSRLDGKIIKLGIDVNSKIDRVQENIEKMREKLEAKIEPIEKDLIQINTRLAVMESRVADIATNVMHLMWQNQSPPSKEVEEL